MLTQNLQYVQITNEGYERAYMAGELRIPGNMKSGEMSGWVGSKYTKPGKCVKWGPPSGGSVLFASQMANDEVELFSGWCKSSGKEDLADYKKKRARRSYMTMSSGSYQSMRVDMILVGGVVDRAVAYLDVTGSTPDSIRKFYQDAPYYVFDQTPSDVTVAAMIKEFGGSQVREL